MGDACGIGPEIIAKWWGQDSRALVIGCPRVMQRAAAWLPPDRSPQVVALSDWRDASGLTPGQMGVWPPPGLPGDLLDAPLARADEVNRPMPERGLQSGQGGHPRDARIIPKSRDFH